MLSVKVAASLAAAAVAAVGTTAVVAPEALPFNGTADADVRVEMPETDLDLRGDLDTQGSATANVEGSASLGEATVSGTTIAEIDPR